MTAPLRLLPDIEQMLSRFLREQPEVVALVEDRVFTDLPRSKTYPMVRVVRIAGDPDTAPPGLLWVDRPLVQLDAWADRKVVALRVMETCRAALATRLVGVQPEGVVARVRFFGQGYQPDPDAPSAQGKAKPRYLVNVEVTTRPAREVAAP